jgi:hypothetical protein
MHTCLHTHIHTHIPTHIHTYVSRVEYRFMKLMVDFFLKVVTRGDPWVSSLAM